MGLADRKALLRKVLPKILVGILVVACGLVAYQNRIRMPGEVAFTGTAGTHVGFLYRFDKSRRVSIEFDAADYVPPIDGQEYRFAIGDGQYPDVRLDIVQFSHPVTVIDYAYSACTPRTARESARWQAVSGDVVLRRTPTTLPNPSQVSPREVSVRLRNVTFRRAGSNEESTIDALDLEGVASLGPFGG
jgi:hypothetical protein